MRDNPACCQVYSCVVAIKALTSFSHNYSLTVFLSIEKVLMNEIYLENSYPVILSYCFC